MSREISTYLSLKAFYRERLLKAGFKYVDDLRDIGPAELSRGCIHFFESSNTQHRTINF